MSLAAALSEAFAARQDPEAVPAASVAVAVGQHVVIEAWGARPATVFQAASVSKPVAAMVAGGPSGP
jgi:CubicO group peptidase (beta-lactamase class C family)